MNEAINENQDLRIVKTEHAIKKAFVSLLKKKPYSKVTVTDIVTKAQINRNTFYLHYLDKEDLLTKLVNDEFGKYDKIIIQNIIEFQTKKIGISENSLKEFAIDILTEIVKDIDFYRLLMLDNDMKGYVMRIKDYARNRFSVLIDTNVNTKKLCLEFCFEGCFGLFFNWIERGGDAREIDDLAFSATKIIYEVLINII